MPAVRPPGRGWFFHVSRLGTAPLATVVRVPRRCCCCCRCFCCCGWWWLCFLSRQGLKAGATVVPAQTRQQEEVVSTKSIAPGTAKCAFRAWSVKQSHIALRRLSTLLLLPGGYYAERTKAPPPSSVSVSPERGSAAARKKTASSPLHRGYLSQPGLRHPWTSRGFIEDPLLASASNSDLHTT